MKETNMEHFRSEIEEMKYDFSLCDGTICRCDYCSPCEECVFDDSIESCTTTKIKWLMSEYKPEPVLTAREKHFVEFAETGWLARDRNGHLFWHEVKPFKKKNRDGWSNALCLYNSLPNKSKLFPFITWEDEEPWSVEELRKLKALEYNPEDVSFKKGGSDE